MTKQLIVMLVLLGSLQIASAQPKSQKVKDFENQYNASVTLNRATGVPDFIRIPRNNALVLEGSNRSEQSGSFIREHGEIFSLRGATDELRLVDTKSDAVEFEHLTYQQYYRGIPIFDGKMRFHYNPEGRLQSINGVFIPFIKVDPNPSVAEDRARELAVDHVSVQVNTNAGTLVAGSGKLYIFRQGLIAGVEGPNHLVYEVVVTSEGGLREFVYVDAHDESIVQQFTGNHGALFRRLYEVNTSNEIWTEGDPFPGSLDQWQQNEIEAAGHTYYTFFHSFGYDSYDGAGAEMRTINNNPNIACPNASWNGSTANYCTGTAADDVVAHEWGHAYTEFTSGLIYAWQSGALNESYSDIWGETVDLLNGYEDAGEDLSIRTGCGSSQRWRMGEDATAFGGAIRDMWMPTCNGDAGKVSDPQYWCSSGDFGGVHSNSGVNNHAYALLVDGGTYNGQTIGSIGIIKAAHIFWRAQSQYLTATSDFRVQADALEASANDLIGIDLIGISTTSTAPGLSGEIITTNDVQQVLNAIEAVEFRLAPACIFDPLLADSPALCAGAGPNNAHFSEDFESGLDGWAVSQHPENPGTWESRDWTLESNMPGDRPGTGIFATDPINGDCQGDLQNGIIRLESPIINLPGSASDVQLSFNHYVATEDEYDGGNIKYSLNGGAWTVLPTSDFTVNPYFGNLNIAGNDNPMAGEPAFMGTDEGSNSGSWGKSTADLFNTGLKGGDNIQFRFELGTDGCNGRVGWYVDNISVYSCEDCVSDIVQNASYHSDDISVEAANTILATDEVEGSSTISYKADLSVGFDPGLSVALGAIIEAIMDGCDLPAAAPANADK